MTFLFIRATAPLLAFLGFGWWFVSDTEDTVKDGWIHRRVVRRHVAIRRVGAA